VIGPIDELEKCLAKLPGLGRRSASRAALALMREKERLLRPLVGALTSAAQDVKCCSRCGAFTTIDRDPCDLCSDALRESGVLCVVEDPADIVMIEASGAFRGRYHSLGGKLAPSRHCGPEKLRFAELQDRVVREGITEVLLAVSNGQTTDQIAATLGISASAVKQHVTAACEKLGAASRSEAAAIALRKHLLES